MTDAGFLDNGEEEPLPDTARVVTRLLRGSLVIFAKGSTYNTIDDTGYRLPSCKKLR